MAHFSESGKTPHAIEHLIGAQVIDAGGNQASIVSIQPGPDPHAWVRLTEGTQVLVPVSLLSEQDGGVFRLPFTFHIADEQKQPMQMSFPVMEEELHVAKRVIDTGRGVRVHKTVTEREQVLDETLQHDELVVEHVAVGRVVAESELPQTRYDGDTLIVPVLEEVLVVQKQLVLKEEVHITRQRRQERAPRTVLLRSEHIAVERFDEGRESRNQ